MLTNLYKMYFFSEINFFLVFFAGFFVKARIASHPFSKEFILSQLFKALIFLISFTKFVKPVFLSNRVKWAAGGQPPVTTKMLCRSNINYRKILNIGQEIISGEGSIFWWAYIWTGIYPGGLKNEVDFLSEPK